MVKVGDEVKKGDVIFEIETDKATLEMESPADGFVKHILAEVEQTLPVGGALMVLGEKDEEIPQSFIDSLKGSAPAAPAAEAPAAAEAAAVVAAAERAKPELEPTKPAGKVKASPRSKKLAEELGVSLAAVTGTGPDGRITEEDVRKAAASKPAAPSVAAPEVKLGETIPLNRIQKITAQKMLQSKREIPCFYLTVKADVTDIVELRTKMNKTSPAKGRIHPVRNSIGNNMTQKGKISNGVKISYNDFIMRAVAIGLEKFPIMTGQLAGDTIRLAEAIGIGLAITVPGGLVAPIVKDVNKKDVVQIARDSKVLIEKARSNKLSLTDLEGGCITVSNLGAFGIDSFIPIVVPGQCSILGIGQITETCVPDNGNIITRKLMNMTLSVDHKVTNGAYAAQFLDFVRKLLEDTSNFEY
ncbi:Dihydrolipoyllysine-residue acetyltransferase component of pyruvate dehydrogenase complex [subsurface metagenome]